MNLISNAAEAMPACGALFVSTENRYINSPVNDDEVMKEVDYVIINVLLMKLMV